MLNPSLRRFLPSPLFTRLLLPTQLLECTRIHSFLLSLPITLLTLRRSTRIFVRGLPPTFTDAEFRAHFSRKNEVTDARLIPHRRIGYIGFKTPEDAQAAVKYFNKTYVRTSKIGVEFAKTVSTRTCPVSYIKEANGDFR